MTRKMSSPRAPGDRRPVIEVLRRNLAKALADRRLEAARDLLERLRTEDPLAAERDVCRRDLAWLYERKGDEERALGAVEAHLERYPRDRLALGQRLRLRARRLSPDELIDEARALEAVGEKVPPEVFAELVGVLLRSGRGREARELVDRLLPDIEPRAASRIGWVCRALEAHDLAFDL